MKKQGRTLFDYLDHQTKVSEYKDPLRTLDEYIDWEGFRKSIMEGFSAVDYSKGGRPPYDKVMLFKVLVLQSLYGLSDAQTEFQIADRLTFMRFLGLNLNDKIPDQNTIRGFRESLISQGLMDKLFSVFNGRLQAAGLLTKKGSMVDATFVTAPRQRNSREENQQLQEGDLPQDWSTKKLRHKDTDAGWTKKNGQTYFGYKNHIKGEIGSKLITAFEVTPASVHDSEVLNDLLTDEDAGKPLYGDSAYRSEEQERELAKKKIESRIHERAYRNKPLSKEQQQNNRRKSAVRCGVEHIFGWMHRMGQELHIRTIGIERALAKITLLNLTYNMTRAIQIIRSGGRSVSIL